MPQSLIKFTPLYDSKEENAENYNVPLCFLLEIQDSCTILLDCGWNSQLDATYLDKIVESLNGKIDAILLSKPSLASIGGLPYLSKKGMNVPIYATIPIYELGRVLLYDFHESKKNCEDFSTFNLDDVDSVFEPDRFVQLKYQQHFNLRGGVQIIPYAAGHMIGGTIWRIKKESEEIIYALHFNETKERHLKGALTSFESFKHFERPALCILDSSMSSAVQLKRKMRDQEILKNILEVIENGSGGSVLIPIDTTGRILELLLILDSHWSRNKLNHQILFFSPFSIDTISYAKSQIEWMSEEITTAFDHARDNPFNFKHIKTIVRRKDFDALGEGPKIVLATMPDLECGFSRDLFFEMAEDPRNRVIFTGRQNSECLASKVLKAIQNNKKNLELTISKRIKLVGQELADYNRKKEEEEEQKRISLELAEQDREDSEDEDEEAQNRLSAFDGTHDMTRDQFKSAGFRHPIFPFTETTRTFDEYGESLTREDFLFEDSVEAMEITQPKKKKKIEEDVEMMEVVEEDPTKVVIQNLNLQINCSIKFVDFEGRSDIKSVNRIIQSLAPRRLILVDGPKENKETIAANVEKNLKGLCKPAFTPKYNETIEIISETLIMKIKLDDQLADSLNYFNVADYQISYIEGVFKNTQKSKKEDENQAIVPVLEPFVGEEKGHQVIYVGEVKLADFRNVLVASGFKSDLERGILGVSGVAGGDANLSLQKKTKEGKSVIELDGSLGRDYFIVRRLLASQYTIV
eukprot:TRINITY_DN9167_c0_g1_i2.p1 TRINITY_DN9167_c0_g1~~TRINITY_DN9167_c0_g1_i2.p1  ORF type:complete len:761 (-),score=328.09 TRINITY_DN9167_c0_g1_i2:47-2296(-)